jgi:glycosyltransferase involved in cell wall biosynthesis
MDESKNVLQFLCFRSPYGGSFFKSLLRLEQTLQNDDIETVYLFHAGSTSDIPWVQDLIREGKKIYFLTGNFLKDLILLKKIVAKHNIKYLHAHFAGAKCFLLFKIIKLLYAKDLFVIRHLRNHDRPRGAINERLRKALNDIDLYIGCSESVAVEFRKNFRVNKEKVTFVTNAIDFRRLDEFEQLDRANFHIDPHATVFLMFGFDYFRKGVDVVLEAVDNLVRNNRNVCLLLSLSVNQEFITSKIIQRFKQVPSWLKILDPRDDVASYYNLCDYFISAAREEGFCNALVEAAYCERPIITSDIPGPGFMNIPHTYKFPSESVSGLENAMISAISLTSAQRRKITTVQKAFVQKNFDLDIWAGQICRLYRTLDKSRGDIKQNQHHTDLISAFLEEA